MVSVWVSFLVSLLGFLIGFLVSFLFDFLLGFLCGFGKPNKPKHKRMNNKEKLKQAAAIQFSTNQPKIIYYGTETGLKQNRSIWKFSRHGDLQVRLSMNWKKQDKELLSFYKNLIKSN